MILWLLIIIPAVLAVSIFTVRRHLSSHNQGFAAGAGLFVLFLIGISLLPIVTEAPVSLRLPWVESLGLELSLYVDGLALLFILIITGVGAAIHVFAGFYFDERHESARFITFLLIFSSSMLGLVSAGNVFTLFICWELTSILSFLLIGFKGKEEQARAGALQALTITGGGGLALIAGLALLSNAAGSSDFSEILTSAELLRSHPWLNAIAILIITACFTKSAQFPFHFWLPDAMSAPTPASAFLHSATMVKAGIYLLLRLQPIFVDTEVWAWLLPTFGFITLLLGAMLALRHRDLKAALAYSTISQLGALVALTGLPHSEGIKAAVIGVLAHALYKSALFLTAGVIDHAAGTRDISKLGGLRRKLPVLAAAAGLAALSMAGVPPMLGFIAKELLIEANLHQSSALIVVLISAMMTVTMACILFWDVFMGERRDTKADHFHAPGLIMQLPPLVLGVASLAFGIFAGQLAQPLIQSILGESASVYLFSPAGINESFMLSLGVLIAGFLVFTQRAVWRSWSVQLPSGTRIYNAVIRRIEALGDLVLTTQNGRVRSYLFTILASVSVMVAVATGSQLLRVPPFAVVIDSASDVLKVILLVFALASTLISIIVRRHLIAALSLGVSGYAIGGIFLLEPAPDVALVQFLVETLATILLMMILTKISAPERQRVMNLLWDRRKRPTLWRDIAISSVVGIGVTFIALSALANRLTHPTIAEWHVDNAYPLTGATDVVAAIVTDFRGMDTLIEISVFSMASLGVLTLLATPEILRPRPGTSRLARLRRLLPLAGKSQKGVRSAALQGNEAEDALNEEQKTFSLPSFSNPLTRMISRVVMPVAITIALSHILYGGGAPGDGFTAGVISGLAIALWYIVFGYHGAREHLRWLRPAYLVGLGLSLGLINAAIPVFLGEEFLYYWKLNASLPGGLKVSSTLLYELAIFLCVAGGTSAIMEAITHPREVEPL
jgi:NADH:ubiquinone oxidoreductase subunit 5 (subunit L)/multisubunit Na+/H+ antiporter MnhA subunit/multisubunit Na+/H+ antiporter MnhB subunit